MKWLKIFRGKSAADYESKGDGLAHDELWGEAKLAFEAGLDKLAREDAADPALGDRLRDKLGRCKESLAQDHYQEALTLTETGCLDEAGELLAVAADLTADADFKSELERKKGEFGDQERMAVQIQFDEIHPPQPEDDLDTDSEAVQGYYEILLGALPEDVRESYLSYGKNFEQGYLALNGGDFDRAAEYLALAAEENNAPQSLVPLELATAYENLGRRAPARELLEELVTHQPACLSAYQLLCEICWEEKQYDEALRLLDSMPRDLAGAIAACELRGGTLLQAERYTDARTYFQDLLQNSGWRQSFAIGLATAHEKLGEPVEALDLYKEISV